MTHPISDTLLHELQQTLIERQQHHPKDSYVASLYHKGLNKILEKIGEEATEVILAAKDHLAENTDTQKALVNEVADLWFHTLIMLTHQGISIDLVLETLQQRQGTSGHVEKALRQKSDDSA